MNKPDTGRSDIYRGKLNRKVEVRISESETMCFPEKTEVFLWTKATYGLPLSEGYVFVSQSFEEGLFFEIPKEAIDWDNPELIEKRTL